MMNHDLQELVKVLQDVNTPLPLHQRALRKRLVDMPPARQGFHCPILAALKARMPDMQAQATCLKIVSAGVVIVVGVLLIGIFVLSPDSDKRPARKLIAEATQKVQAAPNTVAQAGKEYQDIKDCLKDAQESRNLQTATVPEVTTQMDSATQQEVATKHDAAVYITYTSSTDHTIAIALDQGNAPLFALDLDASSDNEKKDKQAKLEKERKDKILKHGLSAVGAALGLE